MIIRSAFIAALSSLSLTISGCAVWPSQEHVAVTNASIAEQIKAHCSQLSTSSQSTDKLEISLIKEQQKQLNTMNEQLERIIAATPGFLNSECSADQSNDAYKNRTIVGSKEWIYVSPPGHHYQARIDSGAATSSLSAVDIEYFDRDSERWVRFVLQHDDESESASLEAKLIRHVLIKQSSSPEPDRRPVVSLTVQLGNDLRYDTEFTLTDRSQMTYPILIGREFLRDITLIDVGREFIHSKYKPKDSGDKQ
ncbi:ATP-dependent zinc protease [Bermanella marisrubri]|uniref:ATP-dependent Zn protease n=1 Tax=Bermanella marisrubri TaxID=207949 RepID=Q1N2A6_9GAMM|nr:ATP-dependent zinc protease [Bermanella marisrubri]EAT12258.1 ATP-dependent Zn protease [Bermanella marisrubri]QIZ85350.1 ATP-dependent zinc protease [Bermanella marisrubri]